MRTFVGIIVGFAFGFMIWFPYGIFYTVQATKHSAIIHAISVLKGLLSL